MVRSGARQRSGFIGCRRGLYAMSQEQEQQREGENLCTDTAHQSLGTRLQYKAKEMESIREDIYIYIYIIYIYSIMGQVKGPFQGGVGGERWEGCCHLLAEQRLNPNHPAAIAAALFITQLLYTPFASSLRYPSLSDFLLSFFLFLS